jgi:hypothetical protein
MGSDETRWRNPFRRTTDAVNVALVAWDNITLWYSTTHKAALRIRAGARHACARLRRERDEARAALATIHRASGRGDGHRSPSDTASCVVDALITARMNTDEAERDAAESGDQELATRMLLDAARRDLAETREALAGARRHAETMREAAHVASEAGRIGAEQVATARAELAALEWLELQGYPVGREPGGTRVMARYYEDREPIWCASWTEAAKEAGMK